MRALDILVAGMLIFLIEASGHAANSDPRDEQLRKEKALVEILKKTMTCKNMGLYEQGDLYCFLRFRGLNLEFAGVNAKGGGTIYVNALGANQTLNAEGSRCILIAFGDPDLRGTIEAHILFRNDGVITHNTANQKAWAECK